MSNKSKKATGGASDASQQKLSKQRSHVCKHIDPVLPALFICLPSIIL